MVWKSKATSKGQGDYPVPPAGDWPAVLVALIQCGIQEFEYQGDVQHAPKVFLVWELPGCLRDGTNQNHLIGRDYRESLHIKSALRPQIESMLGHALGEGEELDWLSLLGKPCNVTVSNKAGNSRDDGTVPTYARVESFGIVKAPVNLKAVQHQPFAWTLEDGEILLTNGKTQPTGKKTPPDHDWLPRIYGKTVAEVIAERRGGNGRQATSPAETTEGVTVAAEVDDSIPF